MTDDKVLSKLLNFGNFQFTKSHFNPLINPETADNVATSLCKVLRTTNNCRNLQLKSKLRQSIVAFTQSLCKRIHPPNVLESAQNNRTAILIKHIVCNRNKPNFEVKHKYLKRRKKNILLYEMLNLNGAQNLNYSKLLHKVEDSMCNENVDFGAALINMESKSSKEALISIVEKCLNSQGNFDDRTREFLIIVWEYKTLLIPVNLFDILTTRLISLVEIKLLKMCTEIIELEDDESVNSIDDKIEIIFYRNFSNARVFIERVANSSFLFENLFFMLNDMFLKSNFDESIQKLIIYFLLEIKCRSMRENLVHLYPYNLRNVIFYLENDPQELSNYCTSLYEYVNDLIQNVYIRSKFEFVLLMSHYEPWISHFGKCKLLNIENA